MSTSVMTLLFAAGETVSLPISGISSLYVNWDDGRGYVSYDIGSDISGTTTGRVDLSGDFTTFGLGSQPWSSAPALLDVSGDLLPSVTSLAGAFHGAINFSGVGLPGWNVSNVTDMSYMLAGTFPFYTAPTLNLGSWNTHAVKNMSSMFCGSTYFNDAAGQGVDMWDVSGVTDMSYMFEGTALFNNTLGSWDTGLVMNMTGMFSGSSTFAGLGLETWDVSGVTDMTNMFNQAVSFNNVDIYQWNTGAVTSMAGMFYKAAGMYNNGTLIRDLSWAVVSVENHTLFLSSDGSQDTSVSDTNSPFLIEGAVPATPFTLEAATAPEVSTDWSNTSAYPAGTQINTILIGQGAGGSNDISGGNAAGIQFSYTFTGSVGTGNISIHNGINGGQLGISGDFSRITFTDGADTYMITAGGGLSDGSGGIVTFTKNTLEVISIPQLNIQVYGAGTNDLLLMNGYQAGGGLDSSLYGAGIGGTPGIVGTAGITRLNLSYPIVLPISGIDASGIMVDFGSSQIPYSAGDEVFGIATGDIKMFGNFSSFGNGATKWPGVELVTQFNWGSTALLDVSGAFNGATILTAIPTTAPSSITDMSYMFSDASGLYDSSGLLLSNINWDVSQVTKSAFFVSSNGIDTTLTDVKSPFYVPASTYQLPPAMTLSFTPSTNVTLPISGVDASGLQVNWYDGSGYITYSQAVANAGISGVAVTGQVDIAGRFTSFGLGSQVWAGVGSLTDVSGTPSGLTDLSGAFNGANQFIGSILHTWDVSGVTDMSYMFRDAGLFTGDGIQAWNVSGVTDMTRMFYYASAFNTNLGNWQRSDSTVANVRNMSHMFAGINSFTGASLNTWNVTGATDMSYMFAGTGINTNLGNWERNGSTVANVRNMASMFYNAESFTDSSAGINLWNVTGVTDMASMFTGAGINTNLGNWERNGSTVANVRNMAFMFSNTESFTGDGIQAWDVSGVTNMMFMFNDTPVFNNSQLSNWERQGSTLANVNTMASMFVNALSMYDGSGHFLYPLNNWNVSNVTDNTYMLANAGIDTTTSDPNSPFYVPIAVSLFFPADTPVTLPISGVDASGLQVNWYDNSGYITYSQAVANAGISGVAVTGQVDIVGRFTSFGYGSESWEGATQLSGVTFNSTTITDLSGAFNGTSGTFIAPTSIPSSVTDLSWLFAEATSSPEVGGWDVSNVTSMANMFYLASYAVGYTDDLSSWNVKKVQNMSRMFQGNGYNGFSGADLSGLEVWQPMACTDMSYMFAQTDEPKLNLSGWAYYLPFSVSNTTFYTNDDISGSPLSPFYANIPAPSEPNFTSIASFTSLPNPFYKLGSIIYGTAGRTLFRIDTSGNNYASLTTLAGDPIGALVGNAAFGPNFFGIVTGSPSALFYYDTSTNTISAIGTFLDTPNPNMTFDATGNLYATDSTGSIYKVTVSSTLVSSNQTLTSIATTPPIVGPLSVSNNTLSGSRSNGALVSVNLGTLGVSATQPIPNALPSSCLAQSGKVYFYDMSGNSLNMYDTSGNSTRLWDFSENSLKGTDPVGQIMIDSIAQKLYGICQEGGPGLGNGARGGGTVWSFQLPSGPMTVLTSYVLGDTTRGSNPVSYSITDMVTSGTASVVTQGGGFNPRFNARVVTYQLSVVTLPGFTSCFNHGSKILRQIRGVDTWSPIETLRRGDLIKTYKHGYRAITNIGKGIMINNPDVWHSCMYTGQKEGHEPLIVTGGHGFLVDNLTLDEQEAQSVFWERGEEVIDDKILMVAPVCKDFKPIMTTDVFTYYHFTVENDGDDDRRYGVYANGFLTETPSVNQYKQHKYHSL